MADDIVKFTAGGSYMPLGAGATTLTLANDHAYGHLRVAIADALPTDNHAAYHILQQRDRVTHDEIPAGFTLYVRSDDPDVNVHGHYRRFL